MRIHLLHLHLPTTFVFLCRIQLVSLTPFSEIRAFQFSLDRAAKYTALYHIALSGSIAVFLFGSKSIVLRRLDQSDLTLIVLDSQMMCIVLSVEFFFQIRLLCPVFLLVIYYVYGELLSYLF